MTASWSSKREKPRVVEKLRDTIFSGSHGGRERLQMVPRSSTSSDFWAIHLGRVFADPQQAASGTGKDCGWLFERLGPQARTVVC